MQRPKTGLNVAKIKRGKREDAASSKSRYGKYIPFPFRIQIPIAYPFPSCKANQIKASIGLLTN